MAYRDFSEMPVWQLAADVVKDVYTLSSQLPRCEDYALRGQQREAAVRNTGNIAEGFGRAHGKDKSNFYFFARGSSYEVVSHLLVGCKAGYFTEDEVIPLKTKCLKIVEELTKIVKLLSSSSGSPSNPKPQP
jgi:four helix bundle protein